MFKYKKKLMKKFIVTFVLLLTAISFTACNNDSDDDDNQSTGDYWPTSVDNNWIYTRDGVESSIKITGVNDRNGAKYYKFNQLDIFGRGVEENSALSIKKNKGDYYINVEEMNLTAESVSVKITGYDFLFFKDYLDVNETWEGTYTYTTSNNANSQVYVTNATFKGKILEKGISLTVKGKVFNDVIKFRFEQILDNNDAWPDWDYSTDFWIAKDVGIIKFEGVEGVGGVSELATYTIK